MVGKDQNHKQDQEQVCPSCIVDIGKGIGDEYSQHDEHQSIHQNVAPHKQEQHGKSRQDVGHRYLGPHCHGLLKVGITASEEQEDGGHHKHSQQQDNLQVKA